MFWSILVGPFYQYAIFTGLHEAIHENYFPEKWEIAYKSFILLCNLPLVSPVANHFYYVHRFHHSFLGSELDVKFPTLLEASYFDTSLIGRIVFFAIQPFVFIWRMVRTVVGEGIQSKAFHFGCDLEMLTFSVGMVWIFGWKPPAYLLLSAYINESFLFQVRKTFCEGNAESMRSLFKKLKNYSNQIVTQCYHGFRKPGPNLVFIILLFGVNPSPGLMRRRQK